MRYIYLILLFLIASCVERIDFPVERVADIVVIDGTLSDEDIPQQVRVGLTAASPRVPIPVSDAQVRLYDGQGNFESYVRDFSKEGTYILQGERLKGEIGKTYFVEVELANGETYRSRPERMLEQQAVLEDIYYDFSIEKETNGQGIVFENLYINAYIDVDMSQADSSFFLKWDVE